MAPTREPFRLAAIMRSALCVFMAVVLAIGLTPIVPKAYAADSTKPDSVMLTIGTATDRIDVSKDVATLDKSKGDTELTFDIADSFSTLNASDKQRVFMLVDSSNNQSRIASVEGDQAKFAVNKLADAQKLMLITYTKDSKGIFQKRYETQLNVRLADTKKAESNAQADGSSTGISKDGGTWSFSNGLQYTFKNTGFKFLDDTTMNLGVLKLPITYKHNPDGTTIAGINCSAEDKVFYEAIKNGNVWQKYSSEAIAKKTSEMDKGWSGKKFGTWGQKKFDWNVCGYMEFNTKDPTAPRAVNLIISMGLKAEGHAQYLCFTGTLTFTVGGKALLSGKLTPPKKIEGKFGLGAYAGLELYIGLGLQYVASVGAYGKGRIDIDFQILPEMYLDSIKLSGEMGAKAKLFGFTIYTWKILDGEKPLYKHEAPKAAAAELPDGMDGEPAGEVGPVYVTPLASGEPAEGDDSAGGAAGDGAAGGAADNTAALASPEQADEPAVNPDGTATSPLTVSASTPYPLVSRDYLNGEGGLMAGQSDALSDMSAQEAVNSTTILKGIYGETELAGVTTNDGPVIVYVADAAQVGGTRDDANRSVLVYSRLKNGEWTSPKIIDTTSNHMDFADFSPSVTTDGDNCYVAWLAADKSIGANASIGEVGGTLDVNVATITKEDAVTVETAFEESDIEGTMPSNPKAVKAQDGLYVGWYTNQTTGENGEVIGLAGEHKVRLYKKVDTAWANVKYATTAKGAITSFDVGIYGGEATCAWSLDENFTSQSMETSLNGTETLENSSVYAMTSDTDAEAALVSSNATNAQFAKKNNADILTYAQRVDTQEEGETGSYLSILSSTAPGDSGLVILNGESVYLPTPYYTLSGDVGENRSGNASFIVTGNGSADVQALVTTGAGDDDWTSIVEATTDDDVVTDYCATYANGLPLFVYTTETLSSASSGMTASEDGGANLNQTTEDSLKHLSIEDVDFDEFDVKAGQTMPVTAYFTNDGMLDVSNVDVYLRDNNEIRKVASSDVAVAIGDTGNATFNYTLPARDAFTKERKLEVVAVPAGATVTDKFIDKSIQDESAESLTIGAASLGLEVKHQVIDGQESIVADVVNDGIVPQGCKLVFTNAATEKELQSVTVPALEEAQTFTHRYNAPNGFFQEDGVNSIIVSLVEGDDDTGYDIKGTEFVSTWEIEKPPAIEQFAGGVRYDTARMIVDAELELGSYAGAIVVAGDGEKFPDALSAAGLAGLLDYPIVMVDGAALNAANEKALDALKKANGDKALDLIVIGGEAAVSSDVEKALAKWGTVSKRIAGSDRYETNALIYDHGKDVNGGWTTDNTFLATGANFPDALAIAPYLVKAHAPIVLVKPDAKSMADVSEAGRGAITNAKQIVALGGTSVVPQAMLIAATASSEGKTSKLLFGDTRYQTGAEIVKWELSQGMSTEGAGIATGKNFPDGLASGFLLGKTNSVLVLVDQNNVSNNAAVVDALDRPDNSVTKLRSFGGDNAVTPEARQQIATAVGMKSPETVVRD